jgi:iron complex outermembrane receptor protein
VFGPNGLVVADLAGSHQDGRMTGKVALNWNVDEDNLLYIFAARGYKPGGANNATSEFGPETVWDYEFGWKGAFLDNHIRTQFGAFYMDYSDFQFDALDITTGQSGVTNISNASIKGLEFQAQAKLDGFSFDGGLAYVHSKLDQITLVDVRNLPPAPVRLPQCVPSSPPGTCFDYSSYIGVGGGGPNLFSPKWSYNFGLQYEAILSDDVTLTPRINYAYVGPRWTNLFYSPMLDYLKGRGLLSAQLTLDYQSMSVQLYGTNLAKKAYVSGQSGNSEFYGAPREFGVRVGVKF